MPIGRRQELLRWAGTERYILEDDYDSEFRFTGHPVQTLQSIDRQGRVIYLNTFSQTIAPSMRISYMVLPPRLVERYRRELGFYACTVPSFEQFALAKFIAGGYFEKHLNRMRLFYRTRREPGPFRLPLQFFRPPDHLDGAGRRAPLPPQAPDRTQRRGACAGRALALASI